MSLDVWFRDDIIQRLNAAHIAVQSARSEQDVMPVEQVAYWRGYETALVTIAVAFGVEWTAENEMKNAIFQ